MLDDETHTGGLHILVADDNQDAAMMLSALLELDGHRTRTVHNGFDAVEEASRTYFDAVLLDLGMPIMDGFEAAALLRRFWPPPVLIACSAWDDPCIRRRTSALGFALHLAKPVRLETLRSALGYVRGALTGRRVSH